MLSNQSKHAATEIVRGILETKDAPAADVMAPLVRDAVIRLETVVALTGLSKPTLYRSMARHEFPRPLKLTAGARGWRLSEVLAWIDGLQREEPSRDRSARSLETRSGKK
jgi:prophage regulatory protein